MSRDYARADEVYERIVQQMPKKQALQMTYADIYKELKQAGLDRYYPGKAQGADPIPVWKPEPYERD